MGVSAPAARGRALPLSLGRQPKAARPSLSKVFLRTSVLLGLCLLAASLLGGVLLARVMKQDLGKAQAEMIAAQVRGEVADHLPEGFFLTPLSPASRKGLESLSEDLKRSLGSRRLKLWDVRGRVIWSDDAGQVGRVSESENLKKALAGEVAYDWKTPGHDVFEWQAFQRDPTIEVYIPLFFPGQKEVASVLEVYADATSLFGHMKNMTRMLWAVGLGGGLLVYVGLLFVVRRASSDLVGAARQNAALYEEVLEGSHRLMAFHELSQKVSSHLGLKEVLNSVVQAVVELLDGDRSRLFLLSEDGKLLRPAASFGWIADPAGGPPELPIGGSLGGTVASEKKALVVDDVRRDPRWVESEWAKAQGLRSFIGVPLFSEGSLIGILNCVSREPSKFKEGDIHLMESLGGHAATALRNAQLFTEVRRVRDRLEALVETAGDAIMTNDLQGKALSWNPAAERIYGYSPEEMVGKDGLVLVPEERRRETLAIRERLKRGEIVKDVETVTRRKGGETFDAQITFSPLRGPGGEVTGYSVITRDISERKEMERELARTNEDLRKTVEELRHAQEMALRTEKLASLGTLVAGVAHEILNPVNNLSLRLQLLERGMGAETPEKLSQALSSMKEEVERVGKIADNLLGFARQKEPLIKPLDFPALLDQILDFVAYEVRLENIEVIREYEEGLPKVLGDEDQLRQVFFNLIQNARDAMPRGGRLTLRAEALRRDGSGWVCVSVEDNGTGIPKEIRGKVFDPFFTTKPEGKGTGLGLSVSYGIVDSHRGKITFESEEGKGTTFQVELPALPEEEGDGQDPHRR